jgi:hypothetical protein
MSNFISLCTNVPIYSPGSFQYSGSLDVMDPARLNSFIEVGERLRIKSGILQSATFDVNVTTGRASGTCAGDVQRDLTIAVSTGVREAKGAPSTGSPLS